MRFSLASIAFVLIATSASAEHAKVTLDVESGGKKETAFVDQTPPDSGKNPRPVFKVKAGEMIKIQWTLTNIYPHKTLEDVLVHSFVAKQGKVGQKDLPTLEGDVEMETAYRMDFKPGANPGRAASSKSPSRASISSASKPETPRAITSISPRSIWWWKLRMRSRRSERAGHFFSAVFSVLASPESWR